MRIEDIKFGNIIKDKTDGKVYKITGGKTFNKEKVVEVKEIHDEEMLCLDYVLKNCEVEQEWQFSDPIF